MRGIHSLLLFAALVSAREPDAAVAGPLRWSDPCGTASGSRRGAALPVTRDVEEAWHLELKEPIVAPPVHWEGRVYLLCRNTSARYLVAVDLLEGKVLARRRLPLGPPTRPVVWDHRVLIRTAADAYEEFRLASKSFNLVWHHRPALGALGDPVVFSSEIYCVANGQLVKLRPGRARHVWVRGAKHARTSLTRFRGRPAVFGDHVYVLGDVWLGDNETVLSLFSFTRRTGALTGRIDLGGYAAETPPDAAEGAITIAPEAVYVKTPAPLAADGAHVTYASVRRQGATFTAPVHLHHFLCPPAVHPDGVLTLLQGKEKMWLLWKGEKADILARESDHEASFRSLVAPTVLGDVVYFGGWAADIKTLEILWRLPVRRISFPLVPADRLVLVVDAGKTLRAFRERARKRRRDGDK